MKTTYSLLFIVCASLLVECRMHSIESISKCGKIGGYSCTCSWLASWHDAVKYHGHLHL